MVKYFIQAVKFHRTKKIKSLLRLGESSNMQYLRTANANFDITHPNYIEIDYKLINLFNAPYPIKVLILARCIWE